MTTPSTIPAGVAASRGFSGQAGETLVQAMEATSRVFVGTGERESFGLTEARRAGATFMRSLAKEASAALDLRGVKADGVSTERLVQAVVEGVGGAAYHFERYRTRRTGDVLGEIVIVVEPGSLEAAERGIARGRAVTEAIWFARDVTNRAPGDLTPQALAAEAADVAQRGAVNIEVLDEGQIAAERLGGLLGVARGSSEPPRLIKLTYEPDGGDAAPRTKVPTIVLVGKGITFDSGGLSLKSPESMIGMKADMAGAAAVIAVVGACRALSVGVRVVGIAPVTENMPGGKAIKPGDVLTIRDGKTIEVLNTDAEGRLVLADGLCLAAEQEPDAIVDIATLTGACVVALGTKVAGLAGNDSYVVGALEAAARRAGESLWRLPLPREYRKDIDSDIADMKNIGKPRQAGALIAGLMLEEFVSGRPWAHIDIAGPANSDEDRYEVRKGATGFGVRTLLEFVQGFEPRGEVGTTMADHIGIG
ncbi:MAG: leucyl aminopeptidase [Acidimicrobiales bacterium]